MISAAKLRPACSIDGRVGIGAAAAAVAFALLVAGCAAGPASESPAGSPAPDMSGVELMVLPVQRVLLPGGHRGGDLAAQLDAEIEYWTNEQMEDLHWVFPGELREALERSPTLTIRLESLATADVRVSDTDYVGDPLLGDIRPLGALVNRRYALLPWEAAYRRGGETSGEAGAGSLVVRFALIDTVGGRVLWRGDVESEPAQLGSGALTASLGRAVARTLLP